MSGRPKQGIDYAGWSVNIFDGDTKIDKLIDAQGWIGFAIYFYLCQMAYKFDGYFYRWGYDDAATTARRMGGGVSSGTVKETVAYCLQIGLFDERTFDGWGVLTSKGIQRRYILDSDATTKDIKNPEYWLLSETEESPLFKIVARRKLDRQRKNQKDRNSEEYAQWRKAVFARDNFTCQMCGKHGGVLNAHHIERHRNNIERRTDVSNGITLCKECHKLLHKIEGM